MPHTLFPGFADPVFSLQVAPDAAVPHPAWRRAQTAALRALDAGHHVVLVGLPGSGKSLLLRSLAHTLREAGRPVHLIGQTEISGNPLAGGVFLIDNADTLGTDALRVLLAGAGPVMLAMTPDGPARLPRCRQPVRHVTLDQLAPPEVTLFVAARLAAAGRPKDFLEPEAVLALAQHSGGVPRLVNVFGSAAVFLAKLDGLPRVGSRHVEEAASMRADLADTGLSLQPGEPTPASSAANLFPGLPSPHGSLLRRRAALGSMAAASGLLFALPWLTSKPSPGLLPADDAEALSLVQATDDAAYTGPASPVVADRDMREPSGASTAAATPRQDPRPEMQLSGVDAASPPQASPRLRVDPPRSAALSSGRRVEAAAEPLAVFHGPIFNETMGQKGQVTMAIRRRVADGAVTARFDASQGLSGTGTLAGRVSGNGRIAVSGQLWMGQNPFLCALNGVLEGDTLTGSASFVRSGKGKVYRSRFNLVRV